MDTKNEYVKASPRDVFLHLGSIVALYGSAIAFLVMMFNLLNIWFPDVAEYYGFRGFEGAVRGAIAAIVVFFPMYIFSLRMLHKTYEIDESRKKISVRKWLLYFTLFVAAFVIAGDVISLIYNFLNGELTTRFLLKIGSVFFVAGSIFWYYRRELKDELSGSRNYLGLAIVTIVVAATVAGFIYAGSPMSARTQKLDEQRISHLSSIQMHIIEYWQSKGSLPENLSVLKDDLRGVSIPQDPETKTEYGYGTKGNNTFVLCAVFGANKKESASSYDSYYYGGIIGDRSWDYKAGKYCFERTIDADFFEQKGAIRAVPKQ